MHFHVTAGWPPWQCGRNDPRCWWSRRVVQCRPSLRVMRWAAALIAAVVAVSCLRRGRDLVGVLTTVGFLTDTLTWPVFVVVLVFPPAPPLLSPPHSTLTTSCWPLASATLLSMGMTGACGHAPRVTPSCLRRRPSSPTSSVAPPSTRLQQAASCWRARSMRIPVARSTMMRVAWYVWDGGGTSVGEAGEGVGSGTVVAALEQASVPRASYGNLPIWCLPCPGAWPVTHQWVYVLGNEGRGLWGGVSDSPVSSCGVAYLCRGAVLPPCLLAFRTRSPSSRAGARRRASRRRAALSCAPRRL